VNEREQQAVAQQAAQVTAAVVSIGARIMSLEAIFAKLIGT
jgi:hypothetical protein